MQGNRKNSRRYFLITQEASTNIPIRSNNPRVHCPPAYGPIATRFTANASLIAAITCLCFRFRCSLNTNVVKDVGDGRLLAKNARQISSGVPDSRSTLRSDREPAVRTGVLGRDLAAGERVAAGGADRFSDGRAPVFFYRPTASRPCC